MKTAMQELIDKLKYCENMAEVENVMRNVNWLEKEKQQIVDAYVEGRNEWHLDNYKNKHGNEYYNQTYKTK